MDNTLSSHENGSDARPPVPCRLWLWTTALTTASQSQPEPQIAPRPPAEEGTLYHVCFAQTLGNCWTAQTLGFLSLRLI